VASWASRKAGASMRVRAHRGIGWVDPDFRGARWRLGKPAGEAFGMPRHRPSPAPPSVPHPLLGQAVMHVVGRQQPKPE